MFVLTTFCNSPFPIRLPRTGLFVMRRFAVHVCCRAVIRLFFVCLPYAYPLQRMYLFVREVRRSNVCVPKALARLRIMCLTMWKVTVQACCLSPWKYASPMAHRGFEILIYKHTFFLII